MHHTPENERQHVWKSLISSNRRFLSVKQYRTENNSETIITFGYNTSSRNIKDFMVYKTFFFNLFS